jgi:hypothetical protein
VLPTLTGSRAVPVAAPAAPAQAAAPAAPAPARGKSSRIAALDITRGWFMIAILAGHSTWNLDHSPLSRGVHVALVPFFRSGTIGFAGVSGILLGSFIATRPDLTRIFARYRQQGLRLFFLVHILLGLELWGPLGEGASLHDFILRRWYITDTLALLFIALVPLLPRLSPNRRLVIGIALMALARPLSYSSGIESWWLQLLQDILFGSEARGPHVLDTYAVSQIGGIFLIGSYVGHHFGLASKRGELVPFARRLLRAVVPLLLASAALVGVWAAVKWELFAGEQPFLRFVFYPDRYMSLFPACMAAVLALLAVICIRSETRPPGLMDRVCLIFGKTSLFTYVFQYLLVQTIPYYLGFKNSMSVVGFAAWTLGACVLTYGAASAWNARVN